jgi:hypothetical protein
MIDRTLRGLALFALLAASACHVSETVDSAEAASPDPSGWRLASGKAPTTAEFIALAASCQDRGGALDSCLTDLGLKRAR